jgi:hypothetical protein
MRNDADIQLDYHPAMNQIQAMALSGSGLGGISKGLLAKHRHYTQ